MLFPARALHRLLAPVVLGALGFLAACGEGSISAPGTPLHRQAEKSSFGYGATIGDFVFIDQNGDGIQQFAEPGIPGVTVNVYQNGTCSGTPYATVVTDGNGLYYVGDLAAGTYSVSAQTPAGYAPTLAHAAGSTAANDSDGACNPVTLATDEDNYDNDFGFVVALAGGQGCTPGYWKNHSTWPAPYIQGSTRFSAVFENAFPRKTLQQVLSQGGGGLNALGRHTVSALLNASSLGAANFGMTPQGVIDAFNAVYPGGDYETLKNKFESMSDAYPGVVCPLN